MLQSIVSTWSRWRTSIKTSSSKWMLSNPTPSRKKYSKIWLYFLCCDSIPHRPYSSIVSQTRLPKELRECWCWVHLDPEDPHSPRLSARGMASFTYPRANSLLSSLLRRVRLVGSLFNWWTRASSFQMISSAPWWNPVPVKQIARSRATCWMATLRPRVNWNVSRCVH